MIVVNSIFIVVFVLMNSKMFHEKVETNLNIFSTHVNHSKLYLFIILHTHFYVVNQKHKMNYFYSVQQNVT